MDILTFVLASPWLLGSAIFIVVFVIVIFGGAFAQGREVSFWPPKIGAKPMPLPVRGNDIADDPNSALESKRSLKSTDTPARSIAGIWLCQYRYPSLDENTKQKVMSIETQVVCFEQKGNQVHGSTIFALAHPEDFEGSITKDRYFTGLYFNKHNHHSYHGAFQFVLSHSHNRMKGRWVGFNREGNDVDSEEWRWLQVDDNVAITEEKKHEYIARAGTLDLFSGDAFL